MTGLHEARSAPASRNTLPEWGLICVAMMVFLGFTMKFRLAPKWIQRLVYRLHTGLATISIVIVLLVTGHMIVD